jgi:hypothetical protein
MLIKFKMAVTKDQMAKQDEILSADATLRVKEEDTFEPVMDEYRINFKALHYTIANA